MRTYICQASHHRFPIFSISSRPFSFSYGGSGIVWWMAETCERLWGPSSLFSFRYLPMPLKTSRSTQRGLRCCLSTMLRLGEGLLSATYSENNKVASSGDYTEERRWNSGCVSFLAPEAMKTKHLSDRRGVMATGAHSSRESAYVDQWA